MHCYWSLHAIRDHTKSYLPPSTGSITRPYPGRSCGRYSIYPQIKDERPSRPELTGKQLAQSRYRSAGYTRCQLVKPAFCPTRHGRCEQLAHSCYTVTGFSGIQTRIFQTRVVERAINSATNVTQHLWPMNDTKCYFMVIDVHV